MTLPRKLSFLATCVYVAISSGQQAKAACDNYQPGTGQTVQCGTGTPNPDTTGVVSANGVTNVTVNIDQGSVLNISNGPALSLGDGSKVVNAGALTGSTSGVLLRTGSSTLTNAGTITGTSGPGIVFQGNGSNTLNNSGNITPGSGNAVTFGSGNDTLLVTDGTINGDIAQGDGVDKADIRNGRITGTLSQGNGIDDFIMSGGTLGALEQGDGRDTFTMSGGTITGAFEDGDVAKMTGGKIGRVNMKLENNIFDMSGGEIVGNLVTGFGDDTIIISGNSTIGGNISVSGGTDSVTITGGTVKGDIKMSNGDDLFHWENGGTIQGAIQMEGDNDLIELKNLDATTTASSPTIDGGAGNDTLNMDNSEYVHSDANLLAGLEHINLTNGSTLTLDHNLLALGDAKNDNANMGYNIDANSTLAIKNDDAVAFKSHLSGTGTLSTDTGGKAFNFTDNNAGDKFAGTLALGNGTLDLSGRNTQALTDATLQAGKDSITTVGSGEQHIGGLAFDGGTVDFGSVAPGNTRASNTLQTAKNLDLSGSGTVKVNVGNALNDRPTPAGDVPLLSQDDANTTIKLAGTDDKVTGGGGSLTLVDGDGSVISNGVTKDIIQDGNSVAEGTWDWRLSSGENQDGLYVAYALKQVDLKGSDDNALRLSADGTASGAAADLSAKVTGSGDLAIDSTGNTVSLSNKDNDYTGVTIVRSGNLLMSNDRVLGNTSLLKMASDTTLDMNGHTQSVGRVETAEKSKIDIHGGSLTVDRGGVINGGLTGAGQLTLNTGTLDINGENQTLKANTAIHDGAIINLDSASGLGSGGIDNAGQLNLNQASGILNNRLSNSGEVNLNATQTTLAGDNSQFSGTFNIDKDSKLTAREAKHLGTSTIHDEGTLVLSTYGDWALKNSVTGTGNLWKEGAGIVTLSDANVGYTGRTDIYQGGLIFGSRDNPLTLATSLVNIDDGVLAGNGTVTGDVDNKSMLQVGSQNL